MADEKPTAAEPSPGPVPAPGSSPFAQKPSRAAMLRAGAVLVLLVVGGIVRIFMTTRVIKVKVAPPPNGAAKPKPAAKPAAPAETVEVARKAVEQRYVQLRDAMYANDPKAALALKTAGFVCKAPEPAGTLPFLAPVESGDFAISTASFKGAELVVENTETIVQVSGDRKKKATDVFSEMARRDTWVKDKGAWMLKQTERLGSVKTHSQPHHESSVNVVEAGEETAAPPETPDDKIAEACVNEIGILCHQYRADIKKAKVCLKKYEDSWLDACRNAIYPPEDSGGDEASE